MRAIARALLRVAPGAALAVLGLACASAAARPGFAITGVNVVDVRAGLARPAMTVLVEDGRIRDVEPSAALALPAGIRRIDGRGHYLIPGLWDMHVHVLRAPRPDVYFPLLIALGVTGVRDMGGDESFAQLRQWRAEIAAGERVGPRFIAPGVFVDGPYPMIPQWSRVAADADSAHTIVRELKRDGADFIKIYNRLPRAAYFALADEAKHLGIPFAGHVPLSVSAREAALSGQRSIEHLFNVSFACSTREDELMRRKIEVLQHGGEAEARRQARRAYLREALATFSAARCEELFALFARLHAWQVPTLVQRRAFAYPQAPDPERLAYVPRSQRLHWDPGQDRRIQGRAEEDREIERQFFDRDRLLIAPMRDAGVGLLAGSDAGDPYSLPGFSLHDELAALVAAGLTPLQALRSATLNAAAFLGSQHQLGVVEPGMAADLVLLDADPLTDIRNTRRIALVVADGRVYDRAALDRLLETARRRADAR